MGAPVRYTCPEIDVVIGSINIAESIAKTFVNNISNKNNEDINDAFKDIVSELKNLNDAMEVLRGANSMLRDWGIEQEVEIKKLESELCRLKSIINDLEHKIETIKNGADKD